MSYFNSSDEQIRKEQSTFHRKESTREFHKGMNKKRVYTPQKKQQKPQTPQPKKFVVKGHDKLLSDALKNGMELTFHMFEWETPIIGKVTSRDRFTVSVEDRNGRNWLLFKSAMIAINYKAIKEEEQE